ncbi:hypothetical protein I4U23_008328 [Adineta vaga]|nr:hypothetical protein I4U23_008328 [Adineta vaga]
MGKNNNENYYFKPKLSLQKQKINSQNSSSTSKSSEQKDTSMNNSSTTYDLEEMIAQIRENPGFALAIHQNFSHTSNQQPTNHQLETSTPCTPKRGLEQSENDGNQVAKQQRIRSNPRQNSSNQNTTSSTTQKTPPTTNRRTYRPNQDNLSETKEHQQRIPFEQLRRAVSSNLPCFFIEYDQTEDSNARPSDVVAAGIIEDHFKANKISISFSLVGHAGNRLKLGVNDKEIYATLVSTPHWPTQINNIGITIIKPKFIPDSFALVVRYVPAQYSDDFVKGEIEKSIKSMENVRRIQYRFQRKSNDYRFMVKDLREYNSTLKLGRLAIGNSFCTITPFLTGNKMTFCTRCWCIGHMRNQCEMEHPRCRTCLDNLLDGQTHNCSNISRCAQCQGDHHSLSNACEKIMEYRNELKQQVDEAIAAGKLKRSIPQAGTQQKQCQMNPNEFPALPSISSKPNPWKQQSTQPQTMIDGSMDDEPMKLLHTLNQNMINTQEIIKCIDDKIDQVNSKMEQTRQNIRLHEDIIIKCLQVQNDIIHSFIWPLMSKNIAGLAHKQAELQKLFDTTGDCIKQLYVEHTMHRNQINSPQPQLSPMDQAKTADNYKSNTEHNQNMIR